MHSTSTYFHWTPLNPITRESELHQSAGMIFASPDVTHR